MVMKYYCPNSYFWKVYLLPKISTLQKSDVYAWWSDLTKCLKNYKIAIFLEYENQSNFSFCATSQFFCFIPKCRPSWEINSTKNIKGQKESQLK